MAKSKYYTKGNIPFYFLQLIKTLHPTRGVTAFVMKCTAAQLPVCVWCSAEQMLRLLFLFSSFFPLRKTNLLLHLTTLADFRILLHLFIRHTHSRVGTKVLQQKDKTAFSELVIFIMHSFRFCSFDEWFPFCFSATYFINKKKKKKKHFLSGLSSRTSWQ